MPAWIFESAAEVLGRNNSNNSFDSSSTAANVNGSVLERLEDLNNRVPQTVSKAITFTAAAFETTTAVTMFTVTGDVLARAYGIVGATAVESDTGNNGTISLGVEDNVAVLIAATTADETQFAAHDVWTDAGTVQADILPYSGEWVLIANSEQIELNVLTEDFTAGTMTLYVEWKPVSAGASVVAA